MPFLRTRPVLSLALPLLCSAMAHAQTPTVQPGPGSRPGPLRSVAAAATPVAGYHWRTLVLQHAKPGDILALMHWNGPVTPETPAPFDLLPLTGSPVPNPAILPDGVRRVFALHSTNSLVVEATEEGFATAVNLVKRLDVVPRSVQFHMELVAVPASRVRLFTPGLPASRLLPLLLAGDSRVAAVPVETATDGHSTFFSVEVLLAAPGGRFRLARIGPGADGHGTSTVHVFRLAPRINADGTITLSLEFATTAPLSVRFPTPRTLRPAELVVYDVTGPKQTAGERLFLFLSPTIVTP